MIDSREPIRSKANLEEAKNFQKRTTKRRRNTSFAQKEVDIKAYILAPEGYETFMFLIYFLSIPYLTGLAFLYLFVAKTSFEHFLNVKLSSFFIIWAIGYEVVAAVILTFIAYSFVRSFKSAV